ncbi:MAG TPA: asparagine--tRNA ligase [Vicinamibacteria bacterium]|nr:asparagine--tRNA ligase [Vicinamibacteria bacterium]
MNTVRIADFGRHVGEEVKVQGWLHNKRSSGKLQFLIVRDGSGFAQMVVVKAGVEPASWEAAEQIGQESALELAGRVKEDKRAPGGFEVEVTSLRALHVVHDYPITPKEHGTAFLMENRHLWIRSQRQHAVLRVRHAVVKAVRDFLDDSGFTLVDTPIFTPAACEGTTTLFAVPYFDEGTAYLTQSGQLYNEATAAAHGKVYCFGPTFRAEKSKTRRHLTEFWMVEPEMSFAHLQDALAVAEGLICSVVAYVLDTRKEELKTLERDVSRLENVRAPFPWLHYDEAIKLIQAKGSQTQWGSDFGGTDETIIAEAHDRPVVVHRFPTQIKAFYMEPDPQRPELTLSADILAPEGYGEIVGGGERMSSADLLLQRIHEHQLPEEAFRWYIDLRRYGSVPHAGFGMGIERVVTWICGLEHLRETIAFPRMLYRIYP